MATAASKHCPACDTELPADAERCFACGRVQGEENRCPSCHAIAGVVAGSQGYVCAACGKPRDVRQGQVVLEAPSIPPARTTAPRAGAGLRLLGVASIALGVIGAAFSWVLIGGLTGLALAVVVGGAGAVLGGTSMRAGAIRSRARQASASRDREQRILNLAEAEGGDLTATAAARALGLSMVEADEALTAMADGSRVVVELDPDGVVHYVFRELAPPAVTPRVRAPEVGVSDAAHEEPAEATARGGTDRSASSRS